MSYQPRQYDPTKASWGKRLTEWRFEPELGDFVEVVSYEVPQDTKFVGLAEDPHPTGYSVIGSRIANERNSNKSRVEELRYPNRVGVVPGDETDGTIVYPPQWEETRNVEELQEFVDRVIITSRLEDRDREGLVDGAHATWAFREELKQFSAFQRKRTWWGPFDDTYLTRISYETDATTGLKERIIRSVVFVALPSLVGMMAPGVSVTYKQVAEATWIREERQLLADDGDSIMSGATPFAAFGYYTRMNFTFPTYIRDFNPNVDIIRTLNRNQRRTIFDIRIRTRREFSANVWGRKIVTYHAASPVRPTMFEWRYVDWKHDGALFRVNIERTIADEKSISAITLMNDTFYGAYNETVVFPASPKLTASEYIGAIGNEKIVDVDVTQIEKRIFRKVETRVFIE